MPLPRLHLFELEDQPWFPTTIRDLATDYLNHIETAMALQRPVVKLLAEALTATNQHHVVDLSSGGGGPVPEIQKELLELGLAVQFTLTDLFPNKQAFARIASASSGSIAFRDKPVDARAVPIELTGYRTLFNAFHHFRPADAIAVLRDAAKNGQPIGIFEIPNRSVFTLVATMLLVPLMVAIATPFIRPFRWRRLLWTYLIPLVPLTCWWDGVVSMLRAYTPAELQSLSEQVGVDGYAWQAGQVCIGSGPGRLTYLLGHAIGQSPRMADPSTRS
jgi:hypothetical protein